MARKGTQADKQGFAPPVRLAPPVPTLPAEPLRQALVGHLGLNHFSPLAGAAGLSQLLGQLHCVQLDPLRPFGTSPDLVAAARLEGFRLGDWDELAPGAAFEHYAKERCLIEPAAFSRYHAVVAHAPYARMPERLARLNPGLIQEIHDELEQRGPCTARDLAPRGRVEPLDWSGWKGTSKASTLALEILWSRLDVVTSHRRAGQRVYDLAKRVFPGQLPLPEEQAVAWLVQRRVEAAGLLSEAGGPQWSILEFARRSGVARNLVEQGLLERVQIEGSSRRYFMPAGFLQRQYPVSDGRLRILAPLDPLVWDRKLVQTLFHFDYVWEVYKPAAARRWGWYVCPLLLGTELVGRVSARIREGRLVVERLWNEAGFARELLLEAFERQAQVCGVALDPAIPW
jgi:uncharacterized protein YcaQ